MKHTTFKIIDGDKETICDILITYHDDDTNKDYMVYTDRNFTKENKLNLYYSVYEELDNGIKLIDSKTDEDKRIGLQLIKDVLNIINI